MKAIEYAFISDIVQVSIAYVTAREFRYSSIAQLLILATSAPPIEIRRCQ
jgi:uncharacterized membrane protein